MADFFDMGGYALYVWVSYAITAGMLLLLLLGSLSASRRAARDVARLKPARPKKALKKTAQTGTAENTHTRSKEKSENIDG